MDIVVSTEPAQKRSRSDSNQAHLVALEAKQDVPRPTPYEGKNQCELDDFLLQCRNTFAMRPNCCGPYRTTQSSASDR